MPRGVWGGIPPKTPEFMCKKLCICSYMFKLQSPPKYSPLDAIHLLRLYHCSKQFLNSSSLMPFSASAGFLSQLFHISKTFPFRAFFIGENIRKESLRERSVRWGQWGMEVMLFFGQKLLDVQCGVGKFVNHRSWNGQTCWKSLPKKIHWNRMQPLTTMPAGPLIQMGS